MRLKLLIPVAAATLAASGAQAMILVDQSPDGIGIAPNYAAANTAQYQNFLFAITVGATRLTGIDVYSNINSYYGFPFVRIGQAVVVKLAPDAGGAPDIGNMSRYATTISAIDTALAATSPGEERFHASFSANVAAGRYWIGMSGDNFEIGQALLTRGTGQPLWILDGDTPIFAAGGVYTGYFNVYGGTVPEPASWAMLIAGFGLVGSTLRARRRRPA